MKRFVWICLAVLSCSFALAVVFYPYKYPLRETELGRIAIFAEPFFILQPFGGLWMLYQAIRYEKELLPYVPLALLVPYAWVWYYFERVRSKKQTRRVAQT